MEHVPPGGSTHVEQTTYQVGRPFLEASKSLGIALDFYLVHEKIENLTPRSIRQRSDEVLIVNASHCLYSIPDSTVLRHNPRDSAIAAIRKLRPTLLIINEQYADLNSPFFLVRLKDALDFYGAMFESIDVALPRENRSRLIFERLVGQDIINVVACEGMQRIVRAETPARWRTRLEGHFFPFPTPPSLRSHLESFLHRYSECYGVVEEEGMLIIKWKNRGMSIMSSWRLPK